MNIQDSIESLGIPVTVALGSAAGLWFLMRWLMSVLVGKIDRLGENVRKDLESTDLKVIRLIERIRLLEAVQTQIESCLAKYLDTPFDAQRWMEATIDREKLERKIKDRNGD